MKNEILSSLGLVDLFGKKAIRDIFWEEFTFAGDVSQAILNDAQRECLTPKELAGLNELLMTEVGWTVGALVKIIQTTRSRKEEMGRVGLRLIKNPDIQTPIGERSRENNLLCLQTISFPQDAMIFLNPNDETSPRPGRPRKR